MQRFADPSRARWASALRFITGTTAQRKPTPRAETHTRLNDFLYCARLDSADPLRLALDVKGL